MTRTASDELVDRALRASCSEMGSRVGMAAKPTRKHAITSFSVLNTVSLAWRIGRTIARAHASNTVSTVAGQMVQECGGNEAAKVLFRGKIVGVERRLHKAHSYGEVTIQWMEDEDDDDDDSNNSNNDGASPAAKMQKPIATTGVLKIPYKNENIYAKHIPESNANHNRTQNQQQQPTYLATVPDLITVLDTQSGRALGVPEYRYGVMVTVLGITCSPRWTESPRGLEIGGPGAFGYEELSYVPLGRYVEPRSVVEEFAGGV